jgi:predicted permease
MMGSLRRVLRRLVNVLRPYRDEAELERELTSHLLLLEDEYRRRGMSADAARRAAILALGGVDQTKEAHRDARSWRWLDDVRRDAVYAMRMLRRHPIAAATTTLSLAIGIGLNAAVFSVVDWVLLRPLPYPDAHELVHVFTARRAPVTGPSGVDYGEFAAFAAAPALRESAAFTNTTRVMSSVGIESVHVMVARVAGDLFATFGMVPEIGRAFTRDEMAAGARVVILGHQRWQRSFSADRQIVGRTVSIDGAPHTVIGVMPSDRGYPRDAEVWRPLTAAERASDDRELNMVGRLRSDVTMDRASMEIATLAQASSKGARTAWVDDVQRTDVGSVKAALEALFAAAILTLLIACANVAALVGARNADRAGEMAVRGALGATRSRLFAQLMIESLMLAMAGGVLGLLLGRWALEALVALAPVSVPRLTEISLDGRILGLGVAASLFAGVSVGLAPALRLSQVGRTSVLNRLGGHRLTPHPNARRALVLAQVAVAVVLTTGAVLFIRSLQHLVLLDHGFRPDRLIAVRLFPPRSFDGDAQRLFQDLAATSETVPGVEAVALSMRLPTQVGGLRPSVSGFRERKFDARAVWRPVSATYFDTVGLPVIAGRRFAGTDTRQAPRVAIVNTAFARDVVGTPSPLDVQLTTSFTDGEAMSIVGVVGDVTPAGEPEQPAIYVPLEQSPIGEGHLLVRTQGDPRAVIPVLRSRLRERAPSLAFDRVGRVAEALEESRAVIRFVTQATTSFAGLSLLLSMIGVYGLTASDVSRRWRELAIRLALGASRRDALWTVIRPCVAVLSAGTALGIVGAVAVAPGLASLLQGVAAADVPTLTVVPILLGSIGLLAATVAARRVLRSDPAATLRSD